MRLVSKGGCIRFNDQLDQAAHELVFQLKEDVAELKQFLDAAKCQRVKDVLSQQLQKWQMQLDEEEKKRAEGAQKEPQMRTQQAAAATVKRSVVKELRQYGT